MFLTDPSWLFGLACVVTPPLITCTDLVQFSQLTPKGCDALGHFTNPLPIVSLIFTLVFSRYVLSNAVHVKKSDRRAASWYLVNAVIFKSIMDTCSGSLQLWPMMTAQYNMLDPRYAGKLDAPTSTTVHLTSALEMLIMVPLCLLTYRAIHRGSGWRYVFEAVTATLQATGTWYFYLAGILHQGTYLRELATTTNLFDFIFYFCFANVFCPLLWIVVPVYRIYVVGSEVAALAKTGSQRQGSVSRKQR